MTEDSASVERNLDWAMTMAQGCQQTYADGLCAACRHQGRKRCAIAAYADRLIEKRYSRLGERTAVQETERG